jgi:PKD repeat protein
MKYSILLFFILFFKIGNSQDTLILQPGPEGKDALFDNSIPYVNWGHTEKFKSMVWDVGGEIVICRGLIYFDLSAIPANAMILDARLDLHFASYEPVFTPHTGQNASYLQRVTAPWVEEEVNWATQPGTTSEGQVILEQSTNPEQDYTDIDLTALIQIIAADPQNNFGMMFRLVNEYPDNCLMFASGDCQDVNLRPRLRIIYLPCDLPTVNFSHQVEDKTVTFTGNSPTSESWYWDFGDGYSSSLKDPVHTYSQEGYYDVCLDVTDHCGSMKYCENIQVCIMPSAGFSYLTEGLTVFFNDTSHFADQYLWSFGDGYYSDLAVPWHTFDTAGFYEVCLETLNVCGKDTVCQIVFVDYTGLKDQEMQTFNIYPNPARDVVYIISDLQEKGIVILNDLNGKEVLRKELIPGNQDLNKIPLNNLLPGIYIVRLDLGSENYFSKLTVIH